MCDTQKKGQPKTKPLLRWAHLELPPDFPAPPSPNNHPPSTPGVPSPKSTFTPGNLPPISAETSGDQIPEWEYMPSEPPPKSTFTPKVTPKVISKPNQKKPFNPSFVPTPNTSFFNANKNNPHPSRFGGIPKMADNRVPTFFTYVFSNKIDKLPDTLQGPHTIAHKYFTQYLENTSLVQTFEHLIQPYPPDRIKTILVAEQIDKHPKMEPFIKDYEKFFSELHNLYETGELHNLDNASKTYCKQIVDVRQAMLRLIEMHPYGSYGWDRPNEKQILKNEIAGKAEGNIKFEKFSQQLHIIVDPHANFKDVPLYAEFLSRRLEHTVSDQAIIKNRVSIINEDKRMLCDDVQCGVSGMLPLYQLFIFHRQHFDIPTSHKMFSRILEITAIAAVRVARDALIQIDLLNRYHSDLCQLDTLQKVLPTFKAPNQPWKSSEKLRRLESEFPLPLAHEWQHLKKRSQLYDSLLSAIETAYEQTTGKPAEPNAIWRNIDYGEMSLEDVVNYIREGLNINNTIRLVDDGNVMHTFPGPLNSIGAPVLYISGVGEPRFVPSSEVDIPPIYNSGFSYGEFEQTFLFTELSSGQDLASFCAIHDIGGIQDFVELLCYLDEKEDDIKTYFRNTTSPPIGILRIFNQFGLLRDDLDFFFAAGKNLTDETDIVDEMDTFSEEDRENAYQNLAESLNWNIPERESAQLAQFEKWRRASITMTIMQKYLNTKMDLPYLLDDFDQTKFEDLQEALFITIVIHHFHINFDANPPQLEEDQTVTEPSQNRPENDSDEIELHIAAINVEEIGRQFVPAEEEGGIYRPKDCVTNKEHSNLHSLSMAFDNEASKDISTLRSIPEADRPFFFQMPPLLQSALLIKTYKNFLQTAENKHSINRQLSGSYLFTVPLFSPSMMLQKNAHIELPFDPDNLLERCPPLYIISENPRLTFLCVPKYFSESHPFDKISNWELDEILNGKTTFLLCLYGNTYFLLEPVQEAPSNLEAHLKMRSRGTSTPEPEVPGGIPDYKP